MYKMAILFYFGLVATMLFLALLALAYALGAMPVIKISLTFLLAASAISYGIGSAIEVFLHGKH